MKGSRRLWIGLGVALLVAIVVANLSRGPGGQVAIQIAEVKRATISSTVRAPGRVQPETQVKLSANVPGEVVRLAVKEGDHVKRGQFLLQIDDTQYRARVREAQAAISAAESNLRLAEASYAQSDATWKRKESLFQQNLVSPEEIDQARTQRSTDKARVDAGQQQVEQARATLQVSEDNLRKTRFESPIDGTITQLNIEKGEIVVVGTMNQPGTVILTVADLARMKVEADVDETDVASVRLGQTAKIKADALPDTTLTGNVVEIANSPYIQDQGTQEQQTNFEVDVMIDGPPSILRPGMTADVEIKTATRDSVLTVPIQALVLRTAEELKPVGKGRRSSQGAKADENAKAGAPKKPSEEFKGVFVFAKGTVEFRKVKPGISSDTDYEVSGNLKPGEQVVIGPHKLLRTLKPGQKAKIEAAKKAKGKEAR
jgi:HlyD family secretion protein